MARRRLFLWRRLDWNLDLFAFLLCVLFLFGSVVGALASFRLDAGSEFSEPVFSLSEVMTWRYLALVWSHLRWLFAVVFLGMTALGLFLIPCLFFLRGFFFSFSFFSLFCAQPSFALLLDYLCVAVLTLVPMLLFGSAGLLRSLAESRGDRVERRFLLPALFAAASAACCLICACFELWLLPMLVS